MGNDKPRLYVRFPKKISEELEVKNLHSLIEIVHLPRQKSSRWCFIEFDSSEKRDLVASYLKNTKVAGKKLVVKHINSKKKKSGAPRSVELLQDLLSKQ